MAMIIAFELILFLWKTVHFPFQEHITVCIVNMDDDTFNIYASYTFTVGFVIPFTIMAFCYIMLVRHVRQKFRNRKSKSQSYSNLPRSVAVNAQKVLKEPRYMAEMRKSIWRIAVFHFICWAPFWSFTMIPHYIQYYRRVEVENENQERPPNW